MAENPSEIVIATHSSIALTDAFNTEITLLRKLSNGQVEVEPAPFFGPPIMRVRPLFGLPRWSSLLSLS